MMVETLDELLQTCKVSVYIDDICIGGVDLKECAEYSFRVLEKLNSKQIQINEAKSVFCVKSVTFLGRNINGKTKTTRTESIERVKLMRKPTDLHSLRCFTGLTGHFRCFIPKYADIVRPLDRLKQKDIPFEWDEKCEQSYQQLVSLISSNPILGVPDWSTQFELSCDASHYGTGAILYQRDTAKSRNKQLKVIGYYSYTFTKPELNYSTTEKECLSVIKAIKYFRSYLEGREFVVNSDHQALSHLLSIKEPKNRLGRWQAFLMSFNLKINHKSGRELTDADAISRLCPDVPLINSISLLNEDKRIKISQDQVKLILRAYHDDPYSGGHDGISRTYYKISARFSWPKMKDDIVDYIRTCDVCQKLKSKFKQSKDMITLPEHTKRVFETMHVDYGELNKKSEGDNRTSSFLVMIDEASRLCLAVPMKEDAKSFIQFLRSHPALDKIKKIISDCGKSFISKATKELAHEYHIKLVTTSPYSPWSNGMAERCVQKIKVFCECFPDFPGGWKEAVLAAAKHNNRSYHRALGCSPFFKAFGYTDWLPADRHFGVDSRCVINERPFSEEQQQAYRKKIQDDANKGKVRPLQMEIGSKILVVKGRTGKKINFSGPYEIKEIMTKDGQQKTIIYDDRGENHFAHIRNCRPYHPRRDENKKGRM